MLDLIDNELSKKGNQINMILRAAKISIKQRYFTADASADAVSTKINSVLREEEQVECLKKKTAENLPLKAGKWQNNAVDKNTTFQSIIWCNKASIFIKKPILDL